MPEITWFNEDDVLIGDDNFSIKTVENHETCEVKSTLVYDRAVLDDENMHYRIEAENFVGKYATHEFGLIGELMTVMVFCILCHILCYALHTLPILLHTKMYGVIIP